MILSHFSSLHVVPTFQDIAQPRLSVFLVSSYLTYMVILFNLLH
jgi:hypothetical protein